MFYLIDLHDLQKTNQRIARAYTPTGRRLFAEDVANMSKSVWTCFDSIYIHTSNLPIALRAKGIEAPNFKPKS